MSIHVRRIHKTAYTSNNIPAGSETKINLTEKLKNSSCFIKYVLVKPSLLSPPQERERGDIYIKIIIVKYLYLLISDENVAIENCSNSLVRAEGQSESFIFL